jgi:hypothetical protein
MLSLTDTGRQAFARLNAATKSDIEQLLGDLDEDDQQRLVRSMQSIERILSAPPEHKVPYILRPHQPGDMGWVVQRHGVLYNREYGWDETFEALIAEIVAAFLQNYDPKRERCWIAEKRRRKRRLCFSRQTSRAQGGIPAREGGEAPRVRPRSRRADVGVESMMLTR